MVDMHRRTDNLALCPLPFLQNFLAVFVGVSSKTSQRWRLLCPILIRVHWNDPNRRALQRSRVVEIAACVARRVAFRTPRNFFRQIFPTLELSLIWR